MRGEGEEPLLILGDTGMGKTTMLFQLAEELPEMRFVYVSGENIADMPMLFQRLAAQPLKFMVAVDDAELNHISSISVKLIPINVLLVATHTLQNNGTSIAGGVFSKRIMLTIPRLDDYADITQRLLVAMGCDLPKERVRSACVDHQVDTKCTMTIASAVAVADSLRGIL